MKQQHINPSSFIKKPSHRAFISHYDKNATEDNLRNGEIIMNFITAEMGMMKDNFTKIDSDVLTYSPTRSPLKLFKPEKTISEFILDLKCMMNRFPTLSIPSIDTGYFYMDRNFEKFEKPSPFIRTANLYTYIGNQIPAASVIFKIPADQIKFILNIETRYIDKAVVERNTGMYDMFMKMQGNSSDTFLKSEYNKYQPGYVHQYPYAQNYPYEYRWEGTNITHAIVYTAHSNSGDYMSDMFFYNSKLNEDELFEVPSTFITLANNVLTSPIHSYTISFAIICAEKFKWLYNYLHSLGMFTEDQLKVIFGIDKSVFVTNVNAKYFSNIISDDLYNGAFNTIIDVNYIVNQFNILDGMNDKSNVFLSPFPPKTEKYNANKLWTEQMSVITQNGDVLEIESATKYSELISIFTPKRIISTHLTRIETDASGMLIDE